MLQSNLIIEVSQVFARYDGCEPDPSFCRSAEELWDLLNQEIPEEMYVKDARAWADNLGAQRKPTACAMWEREVGHALVDCLERAE